MGCMYVHVHTCVNMDDTCEPCEMGVGRGVLGTAPVCLWATGFHVPVTYWLYIKGKACLSARIPCKWYHNLSFSLK